MREIKFRAWQNKKEGGRYPYGMYTWEDIIESIDDEMGWRKSIFSIGTDPDSQITLIQYTGLKDKNGKEIYEGDIVRYAYGFNWGDDSHLDDDRREREEKVEWDDDHLGFSPFCDYDSDCDEGVILKSVEVVGNIYENPDKKDIQ